jgi:hypothetical protein
LDAVDPARLPSALAREAKAAGDVDRGVFGIARLGRDADKQRRHERDDRDDDHQLDEREATLPVRAHSPSLSFWIDESTLLEKYVLNVVVSWSMSQRATM